MDEETKETLGKILELTHENNKMLRGMRSAARWGRAGKLLYWIAVIAISVFLYNYLQPLLTSTLQTYQGILQNAGKIGGAAENVKNLDTTQIQSAISKMLGQTQ
jgi:hypothetical protein